MGLTRWEHPQLRLSYRKGPLLPLNQACIWSWKKQLWWCSLAFGIKPNMNQKAASQLSPGIRQSWGGCLRCQPAVIKVKSFVPQPSECATGEGAQKCLSEGYQAHLCPQLLYSYLQWKILYHCPYWTTIQMQGSPASVCRTECDTYCLLSLTAKCLRSTPGPMKF